MINGKFPNISKINKDDVSFLDSITQQNLGEYNVFMLQHDSLRKLYAGVRDLVMKACEYYDIDFYNTPFYIQAWVNIEGLDSVDDFSEEAISNSLHDHNGGTGYPDFHGYYSVFAEPSVTHYKINNLEKFEQVNKDGVALLSETGHPHTRGYWNNKDKRRMTIAYDTRVIWDFEMDDLKQHWMPLV